MAADHNKKISTLNDELDPKLFLYIAKRNILFLIAFVIIAIAGSFLYLRYTQPVYQTSAILQLSVDEQTRRVLPTTTLQDDDIAKKIELLRSSVFLNRALSKLPLETSYFTKGRFLNHELYRNSPFRVNARVKNSAIYGVPIYFDFPDEEHAVVSFTINNKPQRRKLLNVEETFSFPEVDFEVEVNNFRAIAEQQSLFSRNSHFIVLNNPETIVSKYSGDIKVNVLSAAAKTIQITKSGHNAQKASDIVNSISEEFNIYDLEKKAESASNILRFIEKQEELVFEKLSESEIELDNFRQEHKIDETASSPLPVIQTRIQDLENQTLMIDLEKSIYQEIEESIHSEEEVDIYRLIAIMAGSEFRSGISGPLDRLQSLLLEREQLLYEVTPSSRQIDAMNYQIGIQEKILIESITTLKSNLRAKKKELEGQVAHYEEVLKSRVSDYNIIEYSRLQRVHSINERFYNQLVEKKAEYGIAKAGFVSQNVILERARTPGKPISPIPRNVYISSLMAAIFLGTGIILLKYLFYNEIPSLNDVVKHTGVPVLGVIPKYKNEIPSSQLLVAKKPKSLIAESLRSVRTNLQFIDNEPESKLVAVTSTISGEGKTFFAMNLAGILAFSDKRVIVIDLDMRKPKIHLGFNVDNVNGVSTILSGIDQVDDCIQSSMVKNLDFITAGPVPPNPSELILSERMDKMVKALKKKYDYVIIDNPPVGIVTDGMKSLLMAEYPIYILKANYSKRIFIQNVNRLYSENSISRLSIVLNGVDKNYSSYGYEKGHAYGYYGGYGYGYYEDSETDYLNGTDKIKGYLKKGKNWFK